MTHLLLFSPKKVNFGPFDSPIPNNIFSLSLSNDLTLIPIFSKNSYPLPFDHPKYFRIFSFVFVLAIFHNTYSLPKKFYHHSIDPNNFPILIPNSCQSIYLQNTYLLPDIQQDLFLLNPPKHHILFKSRLTFLHNSFTL